MINFMKQRKLALTFSILLIIGAVALLFVRGLNFGIDFTGGISVELRNAEKIDISQVRTALAGSALNGATMQYLSDEKNMLIRLSGDAQGSENAQAVSQLKEVIAQLYPDIEYRNVDYVGPQVGRELITSGALSLGLAFAAMMIYIWLRFEWHFGLGALLALIHDVVLTLGLFAVAGLEFNLTSVMALLTIIGYSINDSVVIFDRIRENMRKYKKLPLSDVINKSINETLSRTLITAGTTLGALLALALLGGPVLFGFSVALLFGVTIGTYSSIYIAAPILLMLGFSREEERTETPGIKNITVIILVATLVAGCTAKPVYEVHYEFIPPKTEAGLACTERAAQTKRQCISGCAARYDACIARADSGVEKAYNEEYQRYAGRLREYQREMELHHYKYKERDEEREYLEKRRSEEKARCKHEGQCQEYTEVKDKLWRLPSTPEPPDEPDEPTRTSVRAQLRSACNNDCGCEHQFNVDYVACGGQVTPYNMCVLNCEQVK